MKKVIILNATELGYQVIKALGTEGIYSIVIYDQEKDEIGRYSKYVMESIKVPGYIDEPDRLLMFLKDKARQWAGSLIIPTKDYGVDFLAKNKHELSKHYIIPTPDIEVIRKIINKKSLYNLARETGIATPRVFFPKSLDELAAVKDQIKFPCLLKPGLGHLFFRKFDFKMLEIQNYDDLVTHYKNLTNNFENDEFELMICEIIPGQDSKNMIQYVSYLDQEGELLASMTSIKLRQDPPRYGQGRIIVSQKADTIHEQSLSLLRKLGYYGFSEIEWKYDPRDDRFKLVEINPRFIFYIGLCVVCGINFPYIQYLDLIHQKKIKLNSYEENIYWIHLYKDLLHTILHHRFEDLDFREYVTPYLRKKVFAVLSFKDPLPFFHQWKQHLLNMFKKNLNRICKVRARKNYS